MSFEPLACWVITPNRIASCRLSLQEPNLICWAATSFSLKFQAKRFHLLLPFCDPSTYGLMESSSCFNAAIHLSSDPFKGTINSACEGSLVRSDSCFRIFARLSRSPERVVTAPGAPLIPEMKSYTCRVLLSATPTMLTTPATTEKGSVILYQQEIC